MRLKCRFVIQLSDCYSTAREYKDTSYFFFEESRQAHHWCSGRIKDCLKLAVKSNYGKTILCDQMVASCTMHLLPREPADNPLILVGGMGPIAGLLCTQKFLSCMGNRREVILFQVCHTPCRSRAISQALTGNQTLSQEITRLLTDASLSGLQLKYSQQPADLVVLCNTAHYFIAKSESIRKDEQIYWHSLIEASIKAARNTKSECLLPLTSAGSRESALYSKPLKACGISQKLLSDKQQLLLNCAIEKGVKAADFEATLYWGSDFFGSLKDELPDCLLAGCTEIIPMIELLRERGEDWLSTYLQQTSIIDPIDEVIKQLVSPEGTLD